MDFQNIIINIFVTKKLLYYCVVVCVKLNYVLCSQYGILPTYMYIRQSRYWQIDYPRFLVLRKAIKRICSNTAFYVHLRKLFRNWSKFSSSALVLETFNVKYCSELKICLNFGIIFLLNIKKNVFLHLIFMAFHATKYPWSISILSDI